MTLDLLTLDDIEALAVGAWILGTGGGGSPYLGLLNMRRLYAEGHRVELMSPVNLADDDRVAVVSNMGAPLVGQEEKDVGLGRLACTRECRGRKKDG